MKRDPDTDAPNLFAFARNYPHGYPPKARELSPKSIQAYRISLECFLGHLTEAEGIDRAQVGFEHFDRVHLKAWLAWMHEQRHYAPRTIAPRLTAIKTFLTSSGHEDITLIALSQAAKAPRAPASPRTPIEYLTEPETPAVLAAHAGLTTKSRRNRMPLIPLYNTAARVSEITELTPHDLALTPPGHVIPTGKRNKTPTIPISSTTIEHPRVHLAKSHPNHAQPPATRPLFHSQHHGHPSKLSTDTVAAVLEGPPVFRIANPLGFPSRKRGNTCLRTVGCSLLSTRMKPREWWSSCHGRSPRSPVSSGSTSKLCAIG